MSSTPCPVGPQNNPPLLVVSWVCPDRLLVPTARLPSGKIVYATHDAYFSYEFVHCSDRSTPLDLREMLRAIVSKNVSDICVPPGDDRLYMPRLNLIADHAAGNAKLVLDRTWSGWKQVADKTTAMGAWVNKTLGLFGCPTAAEDPVGNLYYYLLVASWGGDIDEGFVSDVKSIVCSEQNPCTKRDYLPLCSAPLPSP